MTSDSQLYELYGLRVRSQVALSGAEVVANGSPDLEVLWGRRRAIAAKPPEGKLLASFSQQNGQGYTLIESASGYTLRIHSICDFEITPDRRSISVHLDENAEPEMASLFLAGNVLSIVLGLAGECVLHASAVELDGVAIACVGGSGSGKSTLAALLSEAGGDLVTDDVLRLDFSEGRIRCFAGLGEARLRSGATELAQRLVSRETKATVDQRLAIRLRSGRTPKPELRAVLIPRPSREAAELRVAKLSLREALLELLRYPRIVGWVAEAPLRSQFRAVSRLARNIPVYSADVPWGPPFAFDLADRLLRSIELRASSSTGAV